jgi:nucleoside-diphosphate-sugar epimerase
MNKNILIIGATGIIGSPLVEKLQQNGEFNLYTVSLDHLGFSNNVKQIIIDRNSDEFNSKISEVTNTVGVWDAVIDLISFDENTSSSLYKLIGKNTKHFVVLSTVLVYDRTLRIDQPISENSTLAPIGIFSGYVDGKVKIEKFWQSRDDVNWTILRPYHVLGKNSLLGCLPIHNRDPLIVEKILSGQSIRLVNNGNIQLNIIHPEDIAAVVSLIINNKKAYNQAYNLINPEIVSAKQYYTEIASQLGKSINIENLNIREVWQKSAGWEMTTLPHIYSANKLGIDIGYTPSISFKVGIKDALNFPAKPIANKYVIHDRMNKLPRPHKPDWLI